MTKADREMKDQHIVTLMSKSQVEAVDTYMFENRIRSRGEAMRQLIEKALEAEQHHG